MNAFIEHLKPENELEMDQMLLSKVHEDEVIRLNELRRFLETRVGEKKSTILCMKDDIKNCVTPIEDDKKKLIEQKDETSDSSVKLSIESDSCNKIKRLSKENQTKTTRSHEIGTMSTVFKEEKESKISCWNENILEHNTSKEGPRKQIILQRHETTKLSVKLQIKSDLINKLKVLSKERHDGSLRLNESRVESTTLVEAKDMTILRLNENIKARKTSKEVFTKQLLKRVIRQVS